MIDFNTLLRAVAGHPAPAGLADAMAAVLPRYGIDTPLRIAHFVGQVCEETGGFRACVENLNYSAEALLRVWPSHFSAETAAAVAHQPARIAELAYGGRIGNGPAGSGDGSRFIGRGLIQITGRANYEQAAQETGLPLVDHPELLGEWGEASVAASAAFWRRAGCNALADDDNIVAITKRINGGLLNFATRKAYVAKAKAALADQERAAAMAYASAPLPLPIDPAPPPPLDAPPGWREIERIPRSEPVGAAPEPAGPAAEPFDLPSYARSLWTAYGHRALAWSGGFLAAAAAFLHDHLGAVLVFGLLALLIVGVVVLWTQRREAHHRAALQAALAAKPPGSPPAAASMLSDADVARIAAAVAAQRGAA